LPKALDHTSKKSNSCAGANKVTVSSLSPEPTHDEIIRWIPTLTVEEIAVVEHYYWQHKDELNEEDRRIRERNAQRGTRRMLKRSWKREERKG
jgi:hypothetical protein